VAAERIASGEIHIDLDDEAALAGLRKVEADFERTMARIDREEATVDLHADHKRLKTDLDKAKAEVKKYEREVEKSENKVIAANKRRALERRREDMKAARAALDAHAARMNAISDEMKAEARAEAARVARARRDQQVARIAEQQRRRALADEARMTRQQRLMQRELERTNREHERSVTAMEREERQLRRLQRQYVEAQDKVAKFRKEIESIRTPRPIRQRLELKTAEALAEMELIRAELAAMGKVPIHQEIELDVNDRGADTLNKWIRALTETTVRVGPFTTTLAGLSRTMLLLGPIFSGLTGQAAALGSVLGAGLAGAVGVGTAALGAFGVSLGGIGFLLPSLLRDFGNLNTLQNAYHVQVLKTGRNSEKAKTKLKEFEHALGEVAPTTRRAFLSLDGLQTRWRNLSKEARPAFFEMLGAGIDTLNQHFDWFRKTTLAAFDEVNAGWQRWMDGLRGAEATRILRALGNAGNDSIKPLMESLGNIATGVGRVAESFSRHLPGLLRGFRAWTDGFAEATGDTERLNSRTDKLVDSMRAVGRLVMATGRVITAFFSPGVDDGTEMINGWADGLNRLAEEMRTTKRTGLDEWFRQSIDTANRLWGALKPIVQLFFEWTTIMRPFADVALSALRPIAGIAQALADTWGVRTAMQVAFGIWLTGAVMGRVVGTARAMKDIASAMKGMTTVSAGKKLMSFLTGGMVNSNVRGMTPANPVFVKDITGGLGGGRGAPVAAGPGGGGMLSRIPTIARVGGGIAAAAGGVVLLTKALDGLSKSKGLERFDARLQKAVGRRDMTGLKNLRREIQQFGGGDAPEFVQRIDKAIGVIDQLNGRSISKLGRNFRENWNNIRDDTKVTTERIDNLIDYHFRRIKATVGNDSRAAAQAASKNFWAARGAIRDAIKRGAIDTKTGLEKIEDLWIKTMGMYGFSPRQARNMAEGQSPWGGREEGQSGVKKAQGGLIQVGRRGDKGRDNVPMNLGGVPAVVARGEQIAVFNDHQQRKFNRVYPGGLEGFFAGPQRPHGFAAGGIVPVPGFPGESANVSILDEIASVKRRWPSLILTDAFGPGHKSPGHTVTGTAADFSGPDGAMNAAVRALVAAGYLVGYDGSFGSQNWPGHGPSSKTSNYHFHVEFGSKGGGGGIGGFTPDEIKRVTIPQTTGAVGVLGQQMVDIARTAANKNITEAVANSLTIPMAGGHGAGGGAASRSQMIAWAREALQRTNIFPPTMANIAKILELAMKESSWIVRSINNWDVNAKAGNPSGGLMHVTLDKVGGSYARLFDPVQNMMASIVYQKSRYGNLITHSPYAKGGIATMGPDEWARGGKIMQPTLMTGEDKGKHPEFMISSNPMFRNSNLDALAQAASALGIPTARKGRTKIGKTGGTMTSGLKTPKLGKKGVQAENIPAVKKYGALQKREEDTNREISIATSRVKEPDSLIKVVGKDANGDDLYAVDEAALKSYWAQLNAVKVLYDKLLGPGGIMDQLAATASAAYARLATYITNRRRNIASLDSTIAVNKRLARSKDEDTRARAEKRLQRARDLRQDQVQKIGDAREATSNIREDQHDARYRRQEYGVDRDSLIADMGGLRTRAVTDRNEANPEPPDPNAPPGDTEALPSVQAGNFVNARDELYRTFGNNFNPLGGGMIGLGNVAQQAMRSSQGSLGTNAAALTVSSGGAAGSAVARQSLSGGGMSYPVSGAGGLDSGKTVNNYVTNNFPTPPPDPHTWSRNLSWELQAAM
jgi:hypothetical protein